MTGIKLDQKTLSMKVGDSATLSATVTPTDADAQEVLWNSSDSTVAAVANGTVRARKFGTATIVASTISGGFTATCSVDVKENATGIRVDETVELYESEEKKLTVEVITPEGTSTKDSFVWECREDSLLTVHDGLLIARRAPLDGHPVTVTVSTEDLKYKAECRVTVKCHVSAIVLEEEYYEIVQGEMDTISVAVYPSRASDKSVIFTSSNPEVATVDDNGVVKAVSPGSADICVISSDDDECSAVCRINVCEQVSGIILNVPKAELYENESETLSFTVSPSTAVVKSSVWKSLDEDLAVVKDGEVTARLCDNSRKARIQLTVTDAGGSVFIKECEIAVKCHPSSIKVSPRSLVLTLGDDGESTADITATLSPERTSDVSYTWSSSDPSIVEIDAEGHARAKSISPDIKTPVSLRATAKDRSAEGEILYDECEVVVVNCVQGIRITTGDVEVKELSLNKNETKQLTAKLDPENVTCKDVIWESCDSDIASIDETGKLTAKGGGETNIIATSKEGGKSAVCKVTVNVPLTGISLTGVTEGGVLEMNEGDVRSDIAVNFTPEDATDRSVQWKSDDDNSVSVVTGKTEGGCSIIAIRKTDSPIKITATCGGKSLYFYVKVNCPVENVQMTEKNISMGLNKSLQLTANVYPERASKELSWKSDTPSVVSVNDDGIIYTHQVSSEGVKIWAISKADESKKDYTLVKVSGSVILVTSITIDGASTVEKDNTITLTATVLPDNATNPTLSWSSSDESIAIVTAQGQVTGKAKGSVTITASANDGSEKYGTHTVTVTEQPAPIAVTGVSISPAGDFSLDEGLTKQLTAVITPSDATNKGVNWSSSDNSVATVSNSGEVTAVSEGTAIIKVITVDGEFEATSSVTVKERVAVERVTISPEALSLYKGETSSAITATYLPAGAVPKTKTWKSSNAGVATVDGNGKITGVSAGTALITLTADGVTSNACTVTVLTTPQIIIDGSDGRITATGLVLNVGEEYQIKAEITPPEAKDMKLVWSVSQVADHKVKVNNGKVIGLNEGRAVVFVSIENISITTIGTSVKVLAVAPQSLSVSRSACTMKVGEKLTLEPVFNPSNTTNKNVKWSSSNASVVSVSDGVLTALAAGKAEITVTSEVNRKLTAKCYVTVTTGDKEGNTGEGVGFDDLN